MIRILVVAPDIHRFDLTPHYYLADFASVVAFLRDRVPGAEVTAVPAGLLGISDRVVYRELLDQPDFLVLWVRVCEAPAARSLADVCREVSPRTRILAWGDAALWMPRYFTRDPFDGVVTGGDPELVLADGLLRLAAGAAPEHGMAIRAGGTWVETAPGRWLDPAEWPFPDPDVLRPQEYHAARGRFGKQTDDLSFYVSRGCRVGCEWCVDPLKGGVADRRRPPVSVAEFMIENLGRYDVYQCHAPVFTARRAWLAELTDRLIRSRQPVRFKACTLANHLADERLVSDLARAGLVSIGFGVETLTADRGRSPLTPKVCEKLLATVARNLRRHGIEGKAYTQVGLPGQTRLDVLYTHQVIRDLGLVDRPTGATPFHRLRAMTPAQLDATDLAGWDRKSYYSPNCGLTRGEFLRLVCSPETFEPGPEPAAVNHEPPTG